MKNRVLFSLLVFIAAIFSGEGLAATAVIEAVQMPAWLERADRVKPLLPGQPTAGVVRAQLQIGVEGVKAVARAQPELTAGLVFAAHFGAGQYTVEVDAARPL